MTHEKGSQTVILSHQMTTYTFIESYHSFRYLPILTEYDDSSAEIVHFNLLSQSDIVSLLAY